MNCTCLNLLQNQARMGDVDNTDTDAQFGANP